MKVKRWSWVSVILKEILHGFPQAEYENMGVVFDIALINHFVNHLNFLINNILLIAVRFQTSFAIDTYIISLPAIYGKRHVICYIPVLSPSSMEVPRFVSIS
jgi:hypothetical protein